MGNVEVIKNFKTVNGFWKRFEDFIEEHPNMIWRGQANEKWKLHSTWYRYLLENKKDFSLNELINFIKNFESYLARGNIFPFKEKKPFLEWLMYARHFGLPSPYIDFTYSPYVALFFAFYKKSDSKKSVLYSVNQSLFMKEVKNTLEKYIKALDMNALNKLGINEKVLENFKIKSNYACLKFFYLLSKEIGNIAKTNNIERKEKNQFISMFSELSKMFFIIENEFFFEPYPSSSNKRMIRQLGCFIYDTLRYKEEGVDDLEEFIDKKFSKHNEPIMYKWLIPNKFRKKILSKLDLMNINGISLFGDESGAVLDTKLGKTPPIHLGDSKIDFVNLTNIEQLFE